MPKPSDLNDALRMGDIRRRARTLQGVGYHHPHGVPTCAAMDVAFLLERLDAQYARVRELKLALKDCLSTFGPAEEVLVTAERQEAWQAVLEKDDNQQLENA